MQARDYIGPLLVTCSLFLAPFAAQAGSGPSYSVTVAGPAGSIASALNDAGQVVGNYHSYGFLYSNGSVVSIGPSGTVANAINNAGEVAGETSLANHTVLAFRYSNGTMQTFSPYSGDGFRGHTVANGINDAGQIVGYAGRYGPYTIFADANGADTPPFNIRGYDTKATAINNSGAIAATVFVTPLDPAHAFVSVNGVATDIGAISGGWSMASGINDAAQVVGSSNSHAFLYSGGIMTDLGTLGQAQSDALGINNLGQVVGRTYNSVWGDGQAFLYSDGVTMDVNALIDPASGWTIVEARDINNNGQIAAIGYKDGVQYALRLDPASPVPEPGQAAMLLGGLGVFGLTARRRAAARSGKQE